MNEGQVTARGASKAGKPTIHIDGKLYYGGNTDLAGLAVGDRISFTCTSFADGKLWGIDKGWKLISAAPKYPPQNNAQNAASGPSYAPQMAIPQGNPLTEGERLTISNWVGAVAGRPDSPIKDPVDLITWARASLHAIRGAGNPDYVPF